MLSPATTPCDSCGEHPGDDLVVLRAVCLGPEREDLVVGAPQPEVLRRGVGGRRRGVLLVERLHAVRPGEALEGDRRHEGVFAAVHHEICWLIWHRSSSRMNRRNRELLRTRVIRMGPVIGLDELHEAEEGVDGGGVHAADVVGGGVPVAGLLLGQGVAVGGGVVVGQQAGAAAGEGGEGAQQAAARGVRQRAARRGAEGAVHAAARAAVAARRAVRGARGQGEGAPSS